MRTHRYRAWLRDEKRMVPVVSLHFGDKGEGNTVSMWDKVGNSSSFLYVFGENADLLEFTGLKDKNGVEIYEGDILKSAGGVQVVEWHFNRWLLKRKGRKEEFNRLDFQAGFFEVIGNIYENPELLKEGAGCTR